MRRPLPSYYNAASDMDWREAIGENDRAPWPSAPVSVTVPGPCVPCAQEGRIEIAGRCPIHDGGDHGEAVHV